MEDCPCLIITVEQWMREGGDLLSSQSLETVYLYFGVAILKFESDTVKQLPQTAAIPKRMSIKSSCNIISLQ